MSAHSITLQRILSLESSSFIQVMEILDDPGYDEYMELDKHILTKGWTERIFG